MSISGFFGKFAKILYESDEKFKNESLNHLIHMRKTYKNPTFPGYAVKMPNQPSTHLPEERILIIEPSSMFWGLTVHLTTSHAIVQLSLFLVLKSMI